MDDGSEERHEKLLSLANKLHEFLEWHPDQAVHVEPVLEHIGMELKAHSPLSGKCQAKLENFEKNPQTVCEDFKESLSVSMCEAWRSLETGEFTRMSESMRAARSKIFGKCRAISQTP